MLQHCSCSQIPHPKTKSSQGGTRSSDLVAPLSCHLACSYYATVTVLALALALWHCSTCWSLHSTPLAPSHLTACPAVAARSPAGGLSTASAQHHSQMPAQPASFSGWKTGRASFYGEDGGATIHQGEQTCCCWWHASSDGAISCTAAGRRDQTLSSHMHALQHSSTQSLWLAVHSHCEAAWHGNACQQWRQPQQLAARPGMLAPSQPGMWLQEFT